MKYQVPLLNGRSRKLKVLGPTDFQASLPLRYLKWDQWLCQTVFFLKNLGWWRLWWIERMGGDENMLFDSSRTKSMLNFDFCGIVSKSYLTHDHLKCNFMNNSMARTGCRKFGHLRRVPLGMSLVNQFLFVNLHNRSNHIGHWQENSLLLHVFVSEKMRLGWRRQQVLSASLSFQVFQVSYLGLPAHGNWIRNTSQELFRWLFDSDEESMLLKRIIRVEAPFFCWTSCAAGHFRSFTSSLQRGGPRLFRCRIFVALWDCSSLNLRFWKLELYLVAHCTLFIMIRPDRCWFASWDLRRCQSVRELQVVGASKGWTCWSLLILLLRLELQC